MKGAIMAASADLTTLAKVKNYLGIPVSDHDILLTSLIASVSEAVEQYCAREFAAKERTEFHDGSGATALIMRCRPIIAVSSVNDDLSRKFADSTRIAPEAYVFYPEAGVIRLDDGVFAHGLRNVQVVYTAGYAAIPPAVEQAANILAAHFFNRGRQGGDGVASESLGSYTVSYNDSEWPAAAKGLLCQYREVEV